jgi:hypothetical protein
MAICCSVTLGHALFLTRTASQASILQCDSTCPKVQSKMLCAPTPDCTTLSGAPGHSRLQCIPLACHAYTSCCFTTHHYPIRVNSMLAKYCQPVDNCI